MRARPNPAIEVLLDEAARHAVLVADARRGLSSRPLQLSPLWLYDRRGSELFDQITALPEYYLTGAEHRLLECHGHDIAARAAPDTLIELGSGASEKTHVLLDALTAAGLRRCVLVDASEDALRCAVSVLSERHAGLSFRGIVGDFHQHAGAALEGTRRMVAFLGSTIGNLTIAQRAAFFGQIAGLLGPADSFLVGLDLVKAPATMISAYDDPAGVTAQFNRNALCVVNAELRADFHPDSYDHVAVWEPGPQWMEMRLRARSAQQVRIAELNLSLVVETGEMIRTEISTKFELPTFAGELRDAGLEVDATWSTPGEYALVLARRRRTGPLPPLVPASSRDAIEVI